MNKQPTALPRFLVGGMWDGHIARGDKQMRKKETDRRSRNFVGNFAETIAATNKEFARI